MRSDHPKTGPAIMAKMSAETQAVVEQVQTDLTAALDGVPEAEKPAAAAAIRTAAAGWIPAGDESRMKIWMTLIVGLLILAGLCVIGGAILAFKDKDAAALFAAVSGIVGLLVGLFAAPAGASG